MLRSPQFLTFWLGCCPCGRNGRKHIRERTLFRVSSHPFAPRQADSGGTLISRNEAHLHINKAVVGHGDGAREARMNHAVAPLHPLLLPSLIPPSLDSPGTPPWTNYTYRQSGLNRGSSGFYLLLLPSLSLFLSFFLLSFLLPTVSTILSLSNSLSVYLSSCLRSCPFHIESRSSATASLGFHSR